MLVKRTIQVLGYLAVVFISLMMISTVADVTGRYLFNSPIVGTIELNRMLMVYAVFFTIAYAQLVKQHIKIDIALDRMPPKTRLVFEGLGLLFALAVMGFITYGASIAAYQETLLGEAETGIINFPVWPGRIAVALGSLVLCLQYIMDILETRRLLFKRIA